MTAFDSYRTESGAAQDVVRGDFEFSTTPDAGAQRGAIVSECDAWLHARAADGRSQEPLRGFWSSDEVEAYFARRRAEDAA